MFQVFDSVLSAVVATVSSWGDAALSAVGNLAEFLSPIFKPFHAPLLLLSNDDNVVIQMDDGELSKQVFCRDITCKIMESLDVKSLVRLSSTCQTANQCLGIECERREARVHAIEVEIKALLDGPHQEPILGNDGEELSFYQPSRNQVQLARTFQQEARSLIDSGLGWLDHEYNPDCDPSLGRGDPCPVCNRDKLFRDIRISKLKCHCQEDMVAHGLAILPDVFYNSPQDEDFFVLSGAFQALERQFTVEELRGLLGYLWSIAGALVRQFWEEYEGDFEFFFDPNDTLRLFAEDAVGGISPDDSNMDFTQFIAANLLPLTLTFSQENMRVAARRFIESHPPSYPFFHFLLMEMESQVNLMIATAMQTFQAHENRGRNESDFDVDNMDGDYSGPGDDEQSVVEDDEEFDEDDFVADDEVDPVVDLSDFDASDALSTIDEDEYEEQHA